MADWAEARMLVPVDGRKDSARAVALAGRIARQRGVPLGLFSLVPSRDDVDAREQWIGAVASEGLGDMEHTTEVVVADQVVDAIVGAAQPDAFVTMATAGSVRFHGGHFGSVAEGVARALGRPMMMVGPNVDPGPGELTRRIVAPVDGSPHGDAALGPAADLAGRYGIPLWVVTVVSPIKVASEAATHSGAVSGAEANHVMAVAERITGDSAIDVQHEVLHSEDPDRAIVEFTADDGTIVMSTHGHTGLRRLFAGSVTAGVVAHSERGVIVTRPEEG